MLHLLGMSGQKLTNAYVDVANHHAEVREPGEVAGGRPGGAEMGLQPNWKNNIEWSDLPGLPNIRPPTKECT